MFNITDFGGYEGLAKNGYILLPNFIPKEYANYLGTEFEGWAENSNYGGDWQCKKSVSVYNFQLFVEMLCDLSGTLGQALRTPVLPTYAYSRLYLNGCDLEKHTDATRCEISITLHLKGDKEWSFYVEGKPFELSPGDAVLYMGPNVEHWRDPYKGEKYSQVFLHYVRSRGPHHEQMFDMCHRKYLWKNES